MDQINEEINELIKLEEETKQLEERLEEELKQLEERKEQVIERLLEIDEQKKKVSFPASNPFCCRRRLKKPPKLNYL